MLVPALLAMIVSQSGSSPSAGNESVSISYVPCRASANDTVSVWDILKEKDMPVSVRQRTNGFGTRDIRVSLPPGNYDILVAEPGRCTAKARLTILARHPRHLILVGTSEIIFGEPRSSIAGALPVNGLRVRAKCQDAVGKEADYDASIDELAYYFDSLPAPGTCNLQLQLSSWPEKTLTMPKAISLGKYGTGASFAIRDIHWVDLIRASQNVRNSNVFRSGRKVRPSITAGVGAR